MSHFEQDGLEPVRLQRLIAMVDLLKIKQIIEHNIQHKTLTLWEFYWSMYENHEHSTMWTKLLEEKSLRGYLDQKGEEQLQPGLWTDVESNMVLIHWPIVFHFFISIYPKAPSLDHHQLFLCAVSISWQGSMNWNILSVSVKAFMLRMLCSIIHSSSS